MSTFDQQSAGQQRYPNHHPPCVKDASVLAHHPKEQREEPSRVFMGRVHFTPGARTAWHSHAVGQYLHILEGVARVQERGGNVKVVKTGETVYTEPGVEHWHGASPDSFMVHLAIAESPAPGSGVEAATWGNHVTDEEYEQQPGLLS